MTPKEKAKELFKKYYDMKWQTYNHNKISPNIKSMTKSAAKHCTLIAVDEILNSYIQEESHGYIVSDKIIPYWQEVKQEIEKL